MKVKKAGALALAAAMVTMGGVYAAWSYAGSNAGGSTLIQGITLTEAVSDTAVGKLAIVANNTFSIDQADAEYNAKMVYGDVSFTFIPNLGASDSVTNNGIPVRVSFRLNGAGEYDEQEILSLNATHNNPTDGQGYDYFSFVINPVGATENYVEDTTSFDGDAVPDVKTWEQQEDGSFKYTLSGDILANYIKLNPVKLETQAKYSEFAVALRNAKVQVRIADLSVSAS